MKILVGGGSGFIGQALCGALRDAGHEVVILSRSEGEGRLTWDELRSGGLPECDAVVNLAGANLMEKRWTSERKRELFASRIDSTRLLAGLIEKAEQPPKVFVQASAVGYYSSEGRTPQTETSPPGNDFLGRLTQQWEQAGVLPEGHPTRRVILRIGIVLGPEGGLLKRMPLPFCIGGGEQGFAWIHRDDLTGIFLWALDKEGVFNAVAPECVSQREFAKALGRVRRRPSLPMPGWVLQMMLGERGKIALRGPYVAPERTLAQGYHFEHPKLDEALASLLR